MTPRANPDPVKSDMVEIVQKSDFEIVKVYECSECGDNFSEKEADPEGTNRSPCCGKMSSKIGEGLYVEDAEIVIMED